jgi:Flp pilus assembly protein TadB
MIIRGLKSMIQANTLGRRKLKKKFLAVIWGCACLIAAAVPALAGTTSVAPEPSTFLLIGGGLAMVFGIRQYRKRKQ